MVAIEEIFTKQHRPTMAQIALENIREAIEKGLLQPGSRIVESQLSKELGMSRFPVREALCCLEKEGLVKTVPFKGVRVAYITPKDIEDLMMLRCALEELAVRLAIQRVTPEKIEKLQSVLKKMEHALDYENESDILNADLGFHQSICEFAENSRLLNAWLPLASQIRVCLKLEYPLFQTAQDFVSTHIPLFQVIKERNQEKAVKLIREHIYSAIDRIIPSSSKVDEG